MRLISVEKDWKHVLMQKVVTLNSVAVTLLACKAATIDYFSSLLVVDYFVD